MNEETRTMLSEASARRAAAYKTLFEKYARRERTRAVLSLVSGVMSILSGIAILRSVREDRNTGGQAGDRA